MTVNHTRTRFVWLDGVAADRDLAALAVRVAVILCRWLDSTGTCWPAVATIAAALDVTPRAVQRAISNLVDRGHLTIRRGGGRGRTNLLAIVATQDGAPENRDAAVALLGIETPTDRTANTDRMVTIPPSKRVNDRTPKGDRPSPKPRPDGHPNHFINHGPAPAGPHRNKGRDRPSAHRPSAALGDLPPDLAADVARHESRLRAAVAVGRLTAEEADRHRAERDALIAEHPNLMEVELG